MLRIDNMNYNASATSVDNTTEEVLATLNFNADNYSNYYFNVNFNSAAALRDTTVDDDFAEFKARAAAIVTANAAPINN